MTQRLETLRQKYDRYIRTGNHVKALQTMQQIARLSAVQETTERVAVRDLYGALTTEERQKAAHACTKIMLCATYSMPPPSTYKALSTGPTTEPTCSSTKTSSR